MTDREKFEAWFEDNHSVIHRMFQREGDGYYLPSTHQAWRIWQAALASQQPADDGWIEWAGGECPVDLKTKVEARLRNGSGGTSWAWMARWGHDQASDDIIAYRVVMS